MTQTAENPLARTALDPSRPTDFRGLLGSFATGLTIVTAQTAEGPVGFTCQSFSSLSLDPPLITICPSRTSSTWPRIAPGGRFCVNVLSAAQESLSNRFATSGIDKYADVTWHPSPSGDPILEDSLAWLDCRVEHVHEGGDHHIVLGRVGAMGCADRGEPLLFHRGRYASLSGTHHQ